MRDDCLRAASADLSAKDLQIAAAGDPAGRAPLLNEVNASLQNYVDNSIHFRLARLTAPTPS
jgi:hypothetical protein